MIDHEDAIDFVLLSPGGLVGAVFIVIALILYFVANDNADECAKRACRNGTAAVLMDNECRCVEAPLVGGR